MIISLDTETTGVDLYHAARPFYVTICTDRGEILAWEWPVVPGTRKVSMLADDLWEIREWVEKADRVVFQNAKFDVTALAQAGIIENFPWEKVDDTLMAGHLLGSNQPKDLTAMAVQYLGEDILPYEERLRVACVQSRGMARSRFPKFRIARADTPGMPSAGDKDWKFDTWLPKCLATKLRYREPSGLCNHDWDGDNVCRTCGGHFWHIALSQYANRDSEVTLGIWRVQEAMIKRKDLWEIYREKMKSLPPAYEMERRGSTGSVSNQRELLTQCEEKSQKAASICISIAETKGHALTMPKSGRNGSLNDFVFNVLKLPVIKETEKDNPALDKYVLEEYSLTLPRDSEAWQFIRNLRKFRKSSTSVTYLKSYEKYWIPLGIYNSRGEQCWFCLHPNLNPAGTDTLRWSSNNPNEQNISKKETECDECEGEGCPECYGTGKDQRSLRYMFGPAPGREWWSLDFENIERRIPVYKAKQQDIIDLFERPDDPPYFGSEHLLTAHVLHPREFEKCVNERGELDGRIFKSRHKADLYQDTKNGNFSAQYQAGFAKQNLTYKVQGAGQMLASRFSALAELNAEKVRFANKHGYVETEPDRTVNPHRGYPILTSRGAWGKVKPTIPLSYYVQATAMWCTMKAMIRCESQLGAWRTKGFDGFMHLQIHDELDFDFPSGATPQTNLPRVKTLQRLMEQSGQDIGIPLKVSISYHPRNWSEEVKV